MFFFKLMHSLFITATILLVQTILQVINNLIKKHLSSWWFGKKLW